MFVRIRKQPGKDHLIPYAYLVDNRWNPIRKKNEQKIIASLGRMEQLPVDGTIEKIIVALDTFTTKMGFASLANGVVLSDISRENLLSKSLDWGSVLLSRHILAILSLEGSIRRLCDGDRDKKVTTQTALTATTALLAHRLSVRTDASERSTHHWYATEVFMSRSQKEALTKESLTDEDFYRTLDVLIAHKDEIEKAYYDHNRDLFNGELDLVLFDTTSIYYWGASDPTIKYSPTDVLQYGFSKDGKGNLKQLIVGVLMTSDGVPIAHEVFPGNTADTKSFASIISIIKEKYHLKKVILIADRGMISQENLLKLESMKLTYILGVRMRKLPPLLKQKLLVAIEQEDMDKVVDNLYTKEFPLTRLTEKELMEELVKPILKNTTTTFNAEQIMELVKNRRFFVCLNPFVQSATKGKREYFKRIIENKIKYTSTKEWVVKNGYKKYLKFESGIEPALNEEKLREEEIYDGKWIIMTNGPKISSFQAGSYYKTLQTIERGFRDLKSLITVQPLFHWKEERIRAHIFVCFLSLVMKWYICRKLNKYSQKEGRRFIEEMINLKAVAIDESIPLWVRTAINPETQTAMKQLKMMIPSKVIIDGRRKVNAPIGKRGGRPRKDRSQGQLALLKK